MKTASVTDAKNRLSAYLDEVKAGQTVLILDRGRAVARLEPVIGSADEPADDRMVKLERRGLLKRGRGGVAPEILEEAPPRARPGASVLRALLEEREEGR